MLFTEGRFFVFFAVVFGGYWAMRSHPARKAWLLAASWLFYGAWDWRFLGLLWITTLVDYGAGLLLDGASRPAPARRWVLGLALTANLGLLGVFKYFDFFATSGATAAAALGVHLAPPLLQLVLPAGISFYTFQSMSYTIDVYRGMPAERRPVDYALYVAFFPQLVAGPIVRAPDFLPQLQAPRRWADVDVRAALALFWLGFVKKAVIADNIAPIVDAFYASPTSYTVASAWSAQLFYGLQLYGDFSGYSDMAVGSAALLGFRLRENFHAPFLATGPIDYWRRWHTSFSSWLRDYVYFPLGGGRGSEARVRANILVTLLLSGLWHGAGWHYVLFGALHGVAMVNERAFRQTVVYERIPARVRGVLGWLGTHTFTAVARVVFRAPTVGAAGTALAVCLAGATDGTYTLPTWGWAAWGATALGQYAMAKEWFGDGWRRAPAWLFGVGLALAWAAALALRAVEYRPFVYFAF